MSLEPCNVCGTLNAAGTEICLSCGYPTQGSKRPAIFRWVAIALVVCFALPFLSALLNWILLQLNPHPPDSPEPKVSLNSPAPNLARLDANISNSHRSKLTS